MLVLDTFKTKLGARMGIVQRRLISLYTATTPNENALKFISSDTQFVPAELTNTVEINSLSDAVERSPLAEKLYKINGVNSIMLGPNFVTVNKVENSLSSNEELNWEHLSPKISRAITDAVNSNVPALRKSYEAELRKEMEEAEDEEDDVTYEIKELINTRIKPAIQDDGGDIMFRSFDDTTGTVYIKLRGACKSCSLSEDTLKGGIENMLTHYIPEVSSVQAVLDPEEEIAIQEFEKLEKRLKSNRA
mgnify:CR=1 FL=1